MSFRILALVAFFSLGSAAASESHRYVCYPLSSACPECDSWVLDATLEPLSVTQGDYDYPALLPVEVASPLPGKVYLSASNPGQPGVAMNAIVDECVFTGACAPRPAEQCPECVGGFEAMVFFDICKGTRCLSDRPTPGDLAGTESYCRKL